MKFEKQFWMPDGETHFNKMDTKDLITYQSEIRYIASELSSKGTAIDAGAHVGIATVHFSQYFKEVVAFEPCQENFVCLTRNCEKNNNVKPMMMGLGSKNERAVLQSVKDNSGAGYIKKLEDRQYRPEDSIDGKQSDIRITTIDSLEIDCSLIKIDVQGFEREVLEGSLTTIKKNKPVLLIEMEKNSERKSAYRESILIKSLLTSLGYRHIAACSRDAIFVHCNEDEKRILQEKAIRVDKMVQQEMKSLIKKRK